MGAASVEGVIEQGSLWLGCCGWMVSPTVSVRVRRRLMGSLIDELQRREAAAREEAEELRGRIAQLAERLAGVEERLSRLVIARETVEEVLNGSGAEATPATVMPDGVAPSRSGHLSAVGVLAVPPWRAGPEGPGPAGGHRGQPGGGEGGGLPVAVGAAAPAGGRPPGSGEV